MPETQTHTPTRTRTGTLLRLFVPVLALALAALTLAPHAAAQSGATAAPALDGLARQIVQRFDAPGVALAVVKDDQVVLTRGFGVRRLGEPAPVDDHTVFYTASVTKAFTVTGLGMLADQGKFRMDDPIVRHLPEFALADKALGDALTIRDLMAHRTGLPRADMLMVSGLSNAAVLGRLAGLAPAAPLRSRFSYQNQMYLALGLMLERLAGVSWTRFIEDRVLQPIGFRDGNAGGLGHWPASAAAASPHARGAKGVAAIDLVPRDPYGAGGVNASATDMAAWLRFQLGDGTANGARLVGANVLAAQQAPNILVPPNITMPGAVLAAYGLGWFVHDYHGHKIVQHGGNGEGWTSLALMMPDQRLGVAVLTNMHNSALPYALAFAIADRVLGREGRAWADEYLAVERRLGPPPLGAPSSPATALAATSAGTYEHPVYGRATVSLAEGRLRFEYGTLRGVIDGTTVIWQRSDMAAVLGPGRATLQDGETKLLLETGGERVEFTRVR